VWCELGIGGEFTAHDMRRTELGMRYPRHRTVGSAVHVCGSGWAQHVYTFVIATAGGPISTICRAPISTTYYAPSSPH
jgi:hypothetical protein